MEEQVEYQWIDWARRSMKKGFFCRILIGLLLIGVFGPKIPCAALEANNLQQFTVKEVRIDPQTDSPVVVVESLKGGKSFPIWIGFSEAQSIALEMEHVVTRRPMTHDLLRNVLTSLKAKVTRITITDLRDGIYYAAISVLPQSGGTEISIDSRPSDAIALALRMRAPIFVNSKVVDQAIGSTLPIQEISASLRKEFGLGMQELTPDLAKFFGSSRFEGLVVSEVIPGGPADSAGVLLGDIILAMNSRNVSGFKDLYRFRREILEAARLQLTVQRDQGKRRNLTLTLTPRSPG